MAVGQSIITADGINALVEASSAGRTIKPKFFRFSEQDLVLDPMLSASDVHGWVTQDIDGYMRIDDDTVEFVCDVQPTEATHYTRLAGLYLDDGTLFMLAKPPFPFPPQLRQTFKIQLRYQNVGALTDFRYISTDEMRQSLAFFGGLAAVGDELLRTQSELAALKAQIFNK